MGLVQYPLIISENPIIFTNGSGSLDGLSKIINPVKMNKHVHDLALFNRVIDSKLRGYDLAKLRVSDISHGKTIFKRAIVIQQNKSGKTVQFELTDQTRQAVTAWIDKK